MATLKANRPVTPASTVTKEKVVDKTDNVAAFQPWELDLQNAREHLDTEQLVAATKDYERITKGESAFAATKVLSEQLHVTSEMFANWTQGKDGNLVEDYLRDAHNHSGSKDRYAIQAAMSEAIYAAVCASPKEVAEAARLGQPQSEDDNLKAKINAVRARQFGDKPDQLASEDAANRRIANRLTETKDDPELHAIWSEAKAAVGQVLPLRAMGNKLGSIQTNVTRWRYALFLPLASAKLDAYSDAYGTDKIGTVTSAALKTAKNAHKKWRDSVVERGLVDKPDPAEMQAAIDAALDKEVFDALTVVGGKVRTDKEIMEDLNKRLWSLLKSIDEKWSIRATERMMQLAQDSERDKPSADYPVALAPKAKGSNGNAAKREAAEDEARSEVSKTAGKAKSDQAAASEEKQKQRQAKGQAAGAAETKAAPKAGGAAALAERIKTKHKL